MGVTSGDADTNGMEELLKEYEKVVKWQGNVARSVNQTLDNLIGEIQAAKRRCCDNGKRRPSFRTSAPVVISGVDGVTGTEISPLFSTIAKKYKDTASQIGDQYRDFQGVLNKYSKSLDRVCAGFG